MKDWRKLFKEFQKALKNGDKERAEQIMKEYDSLKLDESADDAEEELSLKDWTRLSNEFQEAFRDGDKERAEQIKEEYASSKLDGSVDDAEYGCMCWFLEKWD